MEKYLLPLVFSFAGMGLQRLFAPGEVFSFIPEKIWKLLSKRSIKWAGFVVKPFYCHVCLSGWISLAFSAFFAGHGALETIFWCFATMGVATFLAK
jgi:hypothetical protein